MRRFGIFGIWLLVVVGATMVTWQIVSAADNQVSDRPVAPLNVAAPALADLSTSTTTTPTVATTTIPTTTATSGTPGTTSTPTTTGTSASATTTATSAATQWISRSIPTSGGTVIVRYRPGEVEYQSATPAPGFQVEVDDVGPPRVKVEFESETQKFEVEARWENGDLDVETSASSED